jgi:hypothetical protein
MHAHPLARLAVVSLCWLAAQTACAQTVETIITPTAGGEPRVQHIVVEDDHVRIEELHVRGEARSIKVQPKGLGPKGAYEIMPSSGARDLSPVLPSQRGMAGQRVWNVLQF